MGLIVVTQDDGRKPRYKCLCCEVAVFFEGEETAYERHVVACSNRHDLEMRSMSLRVKVPAIFDPNESGDVEFGRWVRRHRRALLEGRLKM
jgi:hypothetical protein